MTRLTEYHQGVAVIKKKSLLKDAMEKLAAYEDAEDSEMEALTDALMEHICDHVCIGPKVVLDPAQMEQYCANCQVGQYLKSIQIKYDQVNNFVNSQAGQLLKIYRSFVSCDDCIHCQKESDCRWCNNPDGLEGHLEPGTGCTRGKKR